MARKDKAVVVVEPLLTPEAGGSAVAEVAPVGETRSPKDPITSWPEAQVKAVGEAVAAGHILRTLAEVTIRAKSSPTKKDEIQPYWAYFAQNARGMAVLCNMKIEPATPKPETGKDERTEAQKAVGACDYFNYGFDLDLRQPIRVSLEDDIAGPENAIAKAVKQLVDGGLFKTGEAARTFVIERRKAEGMTVPIGA